MIFKEVKSNRIGDKYFYVEHSSGLQLDLCDNRYKVWIYQHKFQILRKMRCDKGSRRNCALS